MFKGSIAALVTPFNEAGEIDFAALSRLLDFHLESGTDGLVIAGTTGESATLRSGEFQALLEAVVLRVDGKIPVIAGTGVNATERTVEYTKTAASSGADAALVVTPYYNRPTQHGLVAHFRAVADEGGLPVLLYNVPSRTAVDMLPETVALLSEHSQVAGVKEAVSSMERLQALMPLCSDSFCVLSGDDGSSLQAMKLGAAGVISVAANVVPAAFVRICRAAAAGNWDTGEAENQRLAKLFDLLSVETNPIPVKWALHEMSLCGPGLRLPLTPLSLTYREALRSCLASLGILNE